MEENLNEAVKHCLKENIIAASILFPPTKNGIKSQLPPPFCSHREMRKKFSPSFHPSPHLDFEINFPLVLLELFPP